MIAGSSPPTHRAQAKTHLIDTASVSRLSATSFCQKKLRCTVLSQPGSGQSPLAICWPGRSPLTRQTGTWRWKVTASHWQQWPAWSPLHQGVAGCGLARQGTVRLGSARRGVARHGRWRTSLKTAQRQAHSLSVFGAAAWPGLAGLGRARLGEGSDERKADSMSRFCDARALTAVARQGLAGPGMAGLGKARARKGTSTRTTQWQH